MSIREYLGSEIGRGGYGTIYMYKDNNSLCIKKTNKNNSCRVWSDEYNKMKKLIKNIGSKNLDSLILVKKFTRKRINFYTYFGIKIKLIFINKIEE